MSRNPTYWLGCIAQLSKLESSGAVPVGAAFLRLKQTLKRAHFHLARENENPACYWLGRVQSLIGLDQPSRAMKELRTVVEQFSKYRDGKD